MEEELKQIGLTRNEIKIYLTLLKIDSGSSEEISEKAGLHRRNVYDALNRLIEKGLASYFTKNKKKFFKAISPEKLLEILKEKEAIITSIIPQLLSISKKAEKKISVQIFEGKEGVKTILDEILKLKKEFYVLASGGRIDKMFEYYIPKFLKKKTKLKINLKAIFPDDEKDRGKELSKEPFIEIKYLPKNYFRSPSGINIYVNKVAIFLWADKPIAILIESKRIASSFKKYFNLMWKIARK